MSPGDFDVRAVFQEELARATDEEVRKSGFEVSDWFWSGPRNAQAALDLLKDETGPQMVQNFIDWYEQNPDIEIWVTPDGIPAIELGIEVKFGEVEVRMVIDLVVKIGTTLVVVDLKTSAKQPVNYRQLAIYACGLEAKYGKDCRPRYGTFFMCRGMGRKGGPQTYFLRPVELDKPQYSLIYLAMEFQATELGIQAGSFPANPGENCGRCGVAYACTEAGGDKARELDPYFPGAKRG